MTVTTPTTALTVWFRPLKRVHGHLIYERLVSLTLASIPGERERLDALLGRLVRVTWNGPDEVVVWPRAKLEVVDAAHAWDPEPGDVEIVKSLGAT